MSYPDHEIFEVGDVYSAEICQKICAQHEGCAYLSYDTGRYTCHLHRAEAARRKEPSEGHIVAPATCNGCSRKEAGFCGGVSDGDTDSALEAGFVANIDLPGDDLNDGFEDRVDSALGCHRLCKRK